MDYSKEAKFLCLRSPYISLCSAFLEYLPYCGCFILYMLVLLCFLFAQTCSLSGGIHLFIIMLRGLKASDG